MWAEPGAGDLDLDGLIAGLGETFDGWIIIEVDRPALPPFDSAQASARWARKLPEAHVDLRIRGGAMRFNDWEKADASKLRDACARRRVRLGVIGGGGSALIGPVHRTAARLDDCIEIVAGVLSSDAEKSVVEAAALGIPRGYASVPAMLSAEALRPDGIDAVAIMTPNDSHYAFAVEALEAGLDVICDKRSPTTWRAGSTSRGGCGTFSACSA